MQLANTLCRRLSIHQLELCSVHDRPYSCVLIVLGLSDGGTGEIWAALYGTALHWVGLHEHESPSAMCNRNPTRYEVELQ